MSDNNSDRDDDFSDRKDISDNGIDWDVFLSVLDSVTVYLTQHSASSFTKLNSLMASKPAPNNSAINQSISLSRPAWHIRWNTQSHITVDFQSHWPSPMLARKAVNFLHA